jgi:uncharacterized protein YdeI (YjbR/CyaY-like superfamily)
MNPKVDFYFKKPDKWQKEIKQLRAIVLSCRLAEELKWGCPCYTHNGNNIVLIHVFKEYCALLFFKGALMNDPNGILIQQTKNVQVPRQVRFTDLEEVKELAPVLKDYIHDAIAVEQKGLKMELKKPEEFDMADEFKAKLDKDRNLKKAFEALTPGRQRAYLLHFSAPKQAKTREARVEKGIPHILDGKGLNDL